MIYSPNCHHLIWRISFFHRLKEAQENIKKITAEKKVETKKINANSLVRADLSAAEKWSLLKSRQWIFLCFLPTEGEAPAEGSQRVFQLSQRKQQKKRAVELEKRAGIRPPFCYLPPQLPLCHISATSRSPGNPRRTPTSPTLHSPPSQRALSVCWTDKRLGLQWGCMADTAEMMRVLKAKGWSCSSSPAWPLSAQLVKGLKGVSGIHNSAG